MKVRNIALCAVLGLVASAGWCQGKRATPSTFDQKPFDVAASSLPSAYRGHDCEALAAAIKKLIPAKTEFEPAADYDKRVAAAGESRLIGGLRLGDYVAFPLGADLLEFKYDAERREAQVGLSAWFTYGSSLTLLASGPDLLGSRVIELSKRTLSTRNYIGANAFGARVRASESRYRVCGVAAKRRNARELAAFASATVHMEPPEAQALKPRLGAVLVGTLATPFVVTVIGSKTATISSPDGYTAEGDGLILDVKDVWFYDRGTGGVVARAAPPERPAANDEPPSNVPGWPKPPESFWPQQ